MISGHRLGWNPVVVFLYAQKGSDSRPGNCGVEVRKREALFSPIFEVKASLLCLLKDIIASDQTPYGIVIVAEHPTDDLDAFAF